MRIAPIQLHNLSFRRVSVELDVACIEKGGLGPLGKGFDFEGVNIATHVGFSPMDEGDAPDRNFLLTLRVVIDNQPPEDGSAAKPSPYLVDIEAGSVIRVANGAEKLGDVEDIVVVNGASLLWAAIREQVCNLTARMPLGIATLPTVNFGDLRKQAPTATAPAKQGKPRIAKPARKPTP